MTFVNQYGKSGSHYWPIVIVLPDACTSLEIKMDNKSTSNWTYQAAGLYKIKDIISADESDLRAISTINDAYTPA
jgi:hypothetical protein